MKEAGRVLGRIRAASAVGCGLAAVLVAAVPMRWRSYRTPCGAGDYSALVRGWKNQPWAIITAALPKAQSS
jgi:hypothetical protein